MEYSILTKDGQLRPPQPEETDESPMDAEEENLLLDETEGEGNESAITDDSETIPDSQPTRQKTTRVPREQYHNDRKRKRDQSNDQTHNVKTPRRAAEAASLETKIEKSETAITKLRKHMKDRTCPKRLRYNVRANITPDEEFKREIGSIRKTAEQEFIHSLAKFHQRRIDRLQNKRKKVEEDKPHFRKATNVVQTREHKTPSATREDNVMKSTDVIKLASDLQAKFDKFSQMMSKFTDIENKQSESYPSVLSVSNKGKEKGINSKTLTERNHRRRKRKNVKHIKLYNEAIETRKKHIKNLSDTELTTEQINLLSRGLKFIPTPVMKENQIRSQLISDFNQFARRMRLKYIYHGKDTVPHPFHVKSSWIPPVQRSVALESYLEEVKLRLTEVPLNKPKNNLPPGERRALRELIQNKEIILKKADKGTTTVIMKRENKINEGQKQLDDRNNYQPLEKPMVKDTSQRVKHLINTLHNEGFIDEMTVKEIILKKADKGTTTVIMKRENKINERQKQLDDRNNYQPLEKPMVKDTSQRVKHLINTLHNEGFIDEMTVKWFNQTPDPPRIPVFYTLTKIHKLTLVGRPIISGCDGPTERLSSFVDKLLQPIAQIQDSYLKDTTHFIRFIENTRVPSNAFLVSMDVTSLYTNIPQEEGITIVCNAYEKFHDKNPPIATHLLKEMLSLILKENSFHFNGKDYLQTHGTAMGTKMAVAFANIFMATIEKEILKQSRRKPLTWKRFIDDIFSLWDTNKEDIDLFIEQANSFHPTIKFTAEISQIETTFLDTTVYKGERFEKERILDVRTHFKSTETFQYTNFNSCHPPGVKKGFVKGEALRLLRTNSSKVLFDKNIKNFKTRLISRGYPESMVEKILSEVKYADRATALTQKQKAQKILLPFVTQFQLSLQGLKNILMEKWHLIENQPLLREILKEPPLISYRKGNSLKDMLVKAKL